MYCLRVSFLICLIFKLLKKVLSPHLSRLRSHLKMRWVLGSGSCYLYTGWWQIHFQALKLGEYFNVPISFLVLVWDGGSHIFFFFSVLQWGHLCPFLLGFELMQNLQNKNPQMHSPWDSFWFHLHFDHLTLKEGTSGNRWTLPGLSMQPSWSPGLLLFFS